jgi:hypothetical protein
MICILQRSVMSAKRKEPDSGVVGDLQFLIDAYSKGAL